MHKKDHNSDFTYENFPIKDFLNIYIYIFKLYNVRGVVYCAPRDAG